MSRSFLRLRRPIRRPHPGYAILNNNEGNPLNSKKTGTILRSARPYD